MTLHDINDYAAIGDCHGIALVAADGSLDWCALPALDADPVCCRLLDDRIGGYLETRPRQAFRAQSRYLPDTNVLETVMRTEHGAARVTDFMPLGRDAAGGPDNFVRIAAPHWFVRVIDVTEGELQLDISMLPCLHWGEQRAQLHETAHGVAWDGGCLLCDRPLQARDYWASGSMQLHAGEQVRLILATSPPADAQAALASVGGLLATTVSFWREWIARCRYHGPYAAEVRRSALALKLLIYAPTGAIAAAATSSLPEVLGGDRNWDYRLSWVRDSTLSLFALSALGFVQEPEAFCEFIFRHAASDTIPSQIVYGIHGERNLAECEKPALQGFSDSRPVRVGNDAYLQDQFDVFGELLDWMLLRKTLGAPISAGRLSLLRRTADHVAANWREPCSDFWERRDQPGQYVYSKMMSWVALDRACELLGDSARYAQAMREIVEDVHRHGIAPAGYLRQVYDRDDSGALALRVPLINFPLPEGCLEATIAEVMRELDTGSGVYRYKGDNGDEPDEGTFVACGFWLADALLFAGRRQEARERFEKMLRQASPLGLYAEEHEVETGRHLGNFPQALSHLAVIHSAVLLEIAEHHGDEALDGTHSHRAHRATMVLQGLREDDNDERPSPASEASGLDLAKLLG